MRGEDMRKKVFKSNCKFRYDEERPDRGAGPGRGAKEGGEKALRNRCQLINWGKRKCPYPEATDRTCPIGKGKR